MNSNYGRRYLRPQKIIKVILRGITLLRITFGLKRTFFLEKSRAPFRLGA